MKIARKILPEHPKTILFSIYLWLGLVFILTLANRNLFTVPIYETGDAAVNALQIINAKSFSEIYGNYSRWGFNHPGPFFFYLYALGEILFHDFIPIFPAPANAHIFTGICIQLAFFVCSLHIASVYFRSFWFLPLALLFAIIHFGLVNQTIAGSVFTSIWPPHVLLFPFLCFLVSCASLATGRIQHLPIAVLCGSVLIHGHVAQPLFVFPIGFGSYVLFVRNDEKNFPDRPFFASSAVRCYHLLAIGIVALFAFPIFLDMLQIRESNFYKILHHLKRRQDKKTWIQAILYIFSFFGYAGNQEILSSPRKAIPIFWDSRWFYYLGWIGIITCTGFLLYSRKTLSSIERKFENYFTVIIIVSLILSLVWAQRQDGLLYNFNAYYMFSIFYCILLIFASHISSFLNIRSSFDSRTPLTIGILALFLVFTLNISWIDPLLENSRIRERLDKVLKADPARYAPKMLFFDHENWTQAAAVALALKRKGIPFYVSQNWGFMFGQQNVFNKSRVPFGSTWSLRPINKAAEEILITDKASLVITPASRPIPRATENDR